jgi:hypothetical protein
VGAAVSVGGGVAVAVNVGGMDVSVGTEEGVIVGSSATDPEQPARSSNTSVSTRKNLNIMDLDPDEL